MEGKTETRTEAKTEGRIERRFKNLFRRKQPEGQPPGSPRGSHHSKSTGKGSILSRPSSPRPQRENDPVSNSPKSSQGKKRTSKHNSSDHTVRPNSISRTSEAPSSAYSSLKLSDDAQSAAGTSLSSGGRERFQALMASGDIIPRNTKFVNTTQGEHLTLGGDTRLMHNKSTMKYSEDVADRNIHETRDNEPAGSTHRSMQSGSSNRSIRRLGSINESDKVSQISDDFFDERSLHSSFRHRAVTADTRMPQSLQMQKAAPHKKLARDVQSAGDKLSSSPTPSEFSHEDPKEGNVSGKQGKRGPRRVGVQAFLDELNVKHGRIAEAPPRARGEYYDGASFDGSADTNEALDTELPRSVPLAVAAPQAFCPRSSPKPTSLRRRAASNSSSSLYSTYSSSSDGTGKVVKGPRYFLQPNQGNMSEISELEFTARASDWRFNTPDGRAAANHVSSRSSSRRNTLVHFEGFDEINREPSLYSLTPPMSNHTLEDYARMALSVSPVFGNGIVNLTERLEMEAVDWEEPMVSETEMKTPKLVVTDDMKDLIADIVPLTLRDITASNAVMGMANERA